MGYYAYDANGYLGDLASNGGWATFVRWAQLQSGPVRALAEEGYTDSPAELAVALTDGPAPPSDVEEVWVGLKDYAGRADAVLIVTDGVGCEDENEPVSRFADWTKDNVTIMDREGYVIEVGPDGKWRRKQPPTEESVTGPDIVPSPDDPGRFADWTVDNVTIMDREGYVIEVVNGQWRRKQPETKGD